MKERGKITDEILERYMDYTAKDYKKLWHDIDYKIWEIKGLIFKVSPNDEKKKRLINILNGTDIHEIKALQEAVKKRNPNNAMIKEIDDLLWIIQKRDGVVEKTKDYIEDYEYFSKTVKIEWWVKKTYDSINNWFSRIIRRKKIDKKQIIKIYDTISVYLHVLEDNNIASAEVLKKKNKFIIYFNSILILYTKKQINLKLLSDIKVLIHNLIKNET